MNTIARTMLLIAVEKKRGLKNLVACCMCAVLTELLLVLIYLEF